MIKSNIRIRKDYSKIRKVIGLPNLIEVQRKSYEKFLQHEAAPEKREDTGLQAVFKSVFPVKDFADTVSLEFVCYSFGPPKYDVDECRQRGMTYAAPLKVTVRLFTWEINEETKAKSVKDVKEQEVYFCEIPLMTDKGTFIINGIERVIVSQLHRSPGVFFGHDKGKTHSSGKILHSARIIPYRGSWLDFEFDPKDFVYVRIDRRRKMYATILLKALGYSAEELLNYFYKNEVIQIEKNGLFKLVDPELLLGQRASEEVFDKKTGELIVKKGRKITKLAIKKLKALNIKRIHIKDEDILGRVSSTDVIDEATGEVLLECNEELTLEALNLLREKKVKKLSMLYIEKLSAGPYLRNTLMVDKVSTPLQAKYEIYQRLRPGEPPTKDSAEVLFNNLFFNEDRYDLSKVGRIKLNYKLGFDKEISLRTLRREDILESVKYLIKLKDGAIGYEIDDIDHLGNRRVRSVGELLENQFRIGLVRMERSVRERMSLQQKEGLLPHDLVNAKPASAVIKEFFGSSQLSQFMDQTNPLSEITHKRRLSALGPSGLTRERAGFEVRDVHPTHYGRICPIETPEGPNIGLIASLSSYAKINDYGFIETPYREVKTGRVKESIKYLSALEERVVSIAQANAPLDKNGKFVKGSVISRTGGEFTIVEKNEVDFMDVSPMQLVSVATSMIPFLENDDANRALMGSNMQRQAVPLLKTAAPLIGTGVEKAVAKDSGVSTVAKMDGIVDAVDASRIVVKSASGAGEEVGVNIYDLVKYRRSNQNTCINQVPIVSKGDIIKKGDIIADGPATDNGELALGQNLLVAFMPWDGYNFEDSILISEKVLKNDLFTSIHIEEFECVARDTKLGKEEITPDIPNVGEDALRNLDDSGIIRIGAEVKQGDILVGKVTPKGETQLSPEEKLLRAIFGEKAGDVRDTSLRVPTGVEGIVIDARVFSRKGSDKDSRTKKIEGDNIKKLYKDQSDEIKIYKKSYNAKVKELLTGQKCAVKIVDEDTKEVILKKSEKITKKSLETFPGYRLEEIAITGNSKVEEKIRQLFEKLELKVTEVKEKFEDKITKLKKGDELAPGVIKMVKVYVAIKRKLAVGDKMSGRHGNKGVISRILPEEDMPYMADGTILDIVLNPLGVPSRMNVGQILETHLGGGARALGNKLAEMLEKGEPIKKITDLLLKIYTQGELSEFLKKASDEQIKSFVKDVANGVFIAVPVFEGPDEDEIKEVLKLANLHESGQTALYDGRTGEKFDQPVTVGIMYMLKLHHLVDDKIHARSIGPYSLVTQQPLGGKAQFGGQRLGEMEVWALEAYGASHLLREFLTVKSDDVAGRTRMYEAIVKGENFSEPGLPESFNVLIKELQSLCLDVELLTEENID
jgi:DNA-directed RNA polymerase subunit beta